jgi:hypothetical protein
MGMAVMGDGSLDLANRNNSQLLLNEKKQL